MSKNFYKGLVIFLVGMLMGVFIGAHYLGGDEIGKIKIKGKGNTQTVTTKKR